MTARQGVKRRAAVRTALWLTAGTSSAPSAYERQLLTDYAQGLLTLDELLELAEHSSPEK